MASGEETRIIKIEIDQGQALKDLEKTESALIDLKNEQNELNDSLKKGTITKQEYVASKVQLDQKIKSETENRKTLTSAINTESNSLNAQKERLKQLIVERNKIDRSTTEGAKKFDDMNKSINTLNGSIKKAEEQGGSFQRNVGNYKGAIDGFTGGAYSAVQGIAAMTKASLAFIATPLGAIIAAIGLAIASLTAYFKGSEEGQNNLNKIMTIGSILMERVTDILEYLGKTLFDAFSNPKQAMIDLFNFLKDNLINRFTAFAVIIEGITELDFKKVANGVIQAGTGIENVVDKVVEIGKTASTTIDQAVKDGARLAKMQADLDKQERKMLTETAKRKLEISELRRQADESEGQAKLDFLNQALDLEKVNADAALANAQLKKDIADEDVRLRGDDKEALKAQAQAEADLFNAQAAYFDETRKMNKERIATQKAVDDATLKRIDDERKFSEQEAANAAKSLQINEAELTKAIETNDKKNQSDIDFATKSLDQDTILAGMEQEVNDASTDAYIENEKKKLRYSKDAQDQLAAQVNATANVINDINGKLLADRQHQLAIETQNVQLHQQEQTQAVQDAYALQVRELDAKFAAGELSEEDYNKQRKALDEKLAADKKAIETDAAKATDELKRKAFEANKKNRIADSIIDGIQAALAAYRSLAPIPVVGVGLAIAASIAAAAFAADQVNQIRKEQYIPGSFSVGGYTGPGAVNDPAGTVHRGEVVWNQADVAAVGGPMSANAMRPTFRGYADGGIVTNAFTNQIDSQFGNQMQMPEVYLSWKEQTDFGNSMAIKAKIVEA